ncbi:hypothetical protein Tco_1069324 [Tanacetum coccineum]|uniref:Uncharacterized protein n=1 Tax=Tanacetum coccineum TaxID=301880 RepID=A0ABQ5HK59_9ASTR
MEDQDVVADDKEKSIDLQSQASRKDYSQKDLSKSGKLCLEEKTGSIHMHSPESIRMIADIEDRHVDAKLPSENIVFSHFLEKDGNPARAIIKHALDFSAGSVVNLALKMKRDMIIKNLDLKPTIDAMMRIPLRCFAVLPGGKIEQGKESWNSRFRICDCAHRKYLVVVLVGVVETVPASSTRIVPEGCPNNPR